jgi:ATP-binding cassette subfamily B protein
MEAPASAGQKFGLRAGFKEIYDRMSPQRRRQFFLVLLLMLAGAVAELATIGAVIPFLALLAKSPGESSMLINLLPGANPLLVAAAAFIGLALFAGFIRIQLVRSSRSFIFCLGHELTVEIQRRVLRQPLSFHIHRNTSTLLTSLNKTETLVYDVLLPLMHAVTGGTIALCVVALLLVVAPLTTFAVAAALALTYGLISATTKRRLAANSRIVETSCDARLQTVQESLGGIREVILDNAESLYLREFGAIDSRLASARATTQFIGIAPRYLIEMVGMVAIAAIALVSAGRPGGLTASLPVLGALALGAQRLLPLVQEVYSGWSTLEGQRSTFGQIIELLSLPVPRAGGGRVAPFDLRHEITIDKVSFSYPTRSGPALDQVSLTIPRASMLAVVGPTGSGKSTLLDVLMGLLPPDEGSIMIDEARLEPATERRWHRSIAHVPQSIFLADSTIARNIGLSLPETHPDPERIVEAAKKAQLHDFVASLPMGYETYVGERGVRLSGGQRQRLGIARAIYKDAPILVLDEATSALDDLTETAVIASLDGLRREGKTIIIVAHRLSTVRHCDLIARMDRGQLVHFGRFEEAVGA